MSVHRALLFVIAALFTAGMTSAASAGCGGCGPAPIVYAAPVVTWTTCGCACSCRGFYGYAAAVEPTPIAPAPIYVVNQGPDYTGPGIMVPYHTWNRPYLGGYGYGRFGYRHYGYGYGSVGYRRYGYGYGRVGYRRYGYGYGHFGYRHYGYGYGHVRHRHYGYGFGVHRVGFHGRAVIHRPMSMGRPGMHYSH